MVKMLENCVYMNILMRKKKKMWPISIQKNTPTLYMLNQSSISSGQSV